MTPAPCISVLQRQASQMASLGLFSGSCKHPNVIFGVRKKHTRKNFKLLPLWYGSHKTDMGGSESIRYKWSFCSAPCQLESKKFIKLFSFNIHACSGMLELASRLLTATTISNSHLQEFTAASTCTAIKGPCLLRPRLPTQSGYNQANMEADSGLYGQMILSTVSPLVHE